MEPKFEEPIERGVAETASDKTESDEINIEGAKETVDKIAEMTTKLMWKTLYYGDRNNEENAEKMANLISTGAIKPADVGMGTAQFADLADNELRECFDEKTLAILLSDEYLHSDGDLEKLREQKAPGDMGGK